MSASALDEAVTAPVRYRRRYQQIRALVDVARLAPGEVDYFVRQWRLTSAMPAQGISAFTTDYVETHRQLVALASGQAEAPLNEWSEPPHRLLDGMVVGPLGFKYNYVQVSVERLRAIPEYLRGNSSAFLPQEHGQIIPLAFPAEFSGAEVTAGLDYLDKYEPWLYEWYTGKASESPYAPLSLAELKAAALRRPRDWFALSLRNTGPGAWSRKTLVAPALIGADFIRFLSAQGSLRGLDVGGLGFIVHRH